MTTDEILDDISAITLNMPRETLRVTTGRPEALLAEMFDPDVSIARAMAKEVES